MQPYKYAALDKLHAKQGNPQVECNALYKTGNNFNGYLKASQAIEFAQHLLLKAQLILDHQAEDDKVVHVWNVGKDNEKLHVGLNEARKGRRRTKVPATWVKVCKALVEIDATSMSSGVLFSEFRKKDGLIHSGYDPIAEAGYITFCHTQESGRRWVCYVTAKGRKMVEKSADGAEESDAPAVATPEQ